MQCKLLLFFCVLITPLAADPWGKDADLVNMCKRIACSEVVPSSASPLSALGEALISFHQNYISHADGPRSHYYPSSSQYTRDAIHKYGFLKGVSMGCDRLMRENQDPWVYRTYTTPHGDVMKWDPVP